MSNHVEAVARRMFEVIHHEYERHEFEIKAIRFFEWENMPPDIKRVYIEAASLAMVTALDYFAATVKGMK